MVVILSGSMMSHPLSLFLGLVFSLTWLDLFLPIEGSAAPRHLPRWLLWLTGGLSLGMLVVTRPLTALAVAIPFALHGLWLLRSGPVALRREVGALAGVAIAVSLLLPLWQAGRHRQSTHEPLHDVVVV